MPLPPYRSFTLIFFKSFLVFTLYCCQPHYIADFEISNKSDKTIKDIHILANSPLYDSSQIVRFELGPSETSYYSISLDPIESDGDYTLKYKIDQHKREHRFGYFTNGSPITKLYQIEIKIDTVTVQEIHSLF